MNTLLKILLVSSPVLALILYYTILKQEQIDVEIKKEDTRFERDFNDFSADLEKDPVKKEKYQARADDAQKELEDLEPEIKKNKDKSDKFSTEFENAMDEFEKMQKKGKGEK